MAGRLRGHAARAHSFNILSVFATLLLAVAAIMNPAAAPAQVSCTEELGQCQTGTCQADGSCNVTSLSGGNCDDGNPCTTNDTCANGTCQGTPVSTGSCDDFNSCTTGDTCMNGECQGTPKNQGDQCDFFGTGKCLGTCQVIDPIPPFFPGGAFCEPPMCPNADNNDCTIEACSPLTGQCGVVFTHTCDDECAAGQCDPTTGECVSMQPKTDGTACNDGEICTGNDTCQAGECLGIGGNVTPPPASPTPTATPTGTNVSIPTSTPTRTATHLAPTASATPTGNINNPTSTATPSITPVPSVCVGACSDPHSVTVDNIIVLVNISLGVASPAACTSGLPPGTTSVTIDLVIQSVNNSLTGCPAAAAAIADSRAGNR